MGFTGFYWVLLGFTEFYWVLPSFMAQSRRVLPLTTWGVRPKGNHRLATTFTEFSFGFGIFFFVFRLFLPSFGSSWPSCSTRRTVSHTGSLVTELYRVSRRKWDESTQSHRVLPSKPSPFWSFSSLKPGKAAETRFLVFAHTCASEVDGCVGGGAFGFSFFAKNGQTALQVLSLLLLFLCWRVHNQ